MTIRSLGTAGFGKLKSPDDEISGALAALRRPAELWMLAGLFVCSLLAYALNVAELNRTMNVAGPVALTAILGWSCYRIVQSALIAIWAPLFWFRLACAAYFGFGALAPHIANEETRSYIYNLYYFDDDLNLKVNLIYVAGVFCTLAFSHLFLQLSRGSTRHAAVGDKNYPEQDSTRFFAFCFLVVGGSLRYGLIVPHTFSIAGTVMPGIVFSLANIYYAGIYLLIRYAVNRNRSYLWFALTLIVAEIAVSIASFAKTELILILVFAFLGLISRNASKSALALGAGAMAFAYFMFQPLVDHGRNQLVLRYGEIRGAGLEERWEIVSKWLGEPYNDADGSPQVWLLRLSYLNINALVIDRYDAGMHGNTLIDAGSVFIPRVLWPNKPIITQLGGDLYFTATGRTGTQFGVGHFAEAYWNFGWVGFIPFMGVLALILSIFTLASMTIMARQDWIMLPVVFLGVNIGLRVDGHFIPDVIGPAWTSLLIGIIINIIFYGEKGSFVR